MEPHIYYSTSILILFEMEALGCVDRIGNPVKAPAPSTADDTMAVDSASRATTSSSTVVSSHPTPTPTTKAETVAHVFPIEGLNPYHNKCVFSSAHKYFLIPCLGGRSRRVSHLSLKREGGPTQKERASYSA